jgi:hypothetical protein
VVAVRVGVAGEGADGDGGKTLLTGPMEGIP